MNKLKIFLSLLALSCGIRNVIAAEADHGASLCNGQFISLERLRDDAFFLKKDIQTEGSDENQKIVWNDFTLDEFKRQRDAFRNSVKGLEEKYIDLEHYWRAMMEARLNEKSVFVFGPPGGAKSSVARALLNVKITQPDGSRKVSAFQVQMNELLGDVQFRGYVEPLKTAARAGVLPALKVINKNLQRAVRSLSKEGREKNAEEVVARFEKAVAEARPMVAKLLETHARRQADEAAKRGDETSIHTDGAMIHFDTALVDEIDKGNPVALAALLDILNEQFAQFGHLTLKVKTQTLVATSNKTIYEFLAGFADQEATARALLDRLHYKVFVPNYMTNKQDRYTNMKVGFGQWVNKVAKQDPRQFYATSQALPMDISSNLDEVDWNFLRKVSAMGTRPTEDLIHTADDILDTLRREFYGMRKADEIRIENDGMTGKEAAYYPPTIVSSRYSREVILPTIQASVFLDLMKLPDSVLDSETLAKMFAEKIPLDRYSAYRLQDAALIGVPGIPRLKVSPDGAGTEKVEVVYGPQLAELAAHPMDKRDDKMYKSMLKERGYIVGKYDDLMTRFKVAVAGMSEVQARFVGASFAKSPGAFEKILLKLNPRVPYAEPSLNSENN